MLARVERMLPAQNRMCSSADFSVAMRSGQRVGGRLVVVHHLRGAHGDLLRESLVGLVVSKSVGVSVVRHRVSRRLRAQMATRLHQLPSKSLTVIRALAPAADATSAELARELDRALRRLVVSV